MISRQTVREVAGIIAGTALFAGVMLAILTIFWILQP